MPIAPGSQRAQSKLAPGRGANVGGSRESASKYRSEIPYAASQARRKPGGVSVAPVGDPLRIRPTLGSCWEHHRRSGAIAQRAHRTLHLRVLAARCRRQGSIDVQHDLGLRMKPLDVANEIEGLFRLALGI